MKRDYSFHDPFFITLQALLVRAFLNFPADPKCIWDIGTGCGKVLIESYFRYEDGGKLIGIDNDPRTERYLKMNMDRHGVTADAIQLIQEDITTMDLTTLMRPDAIYLGCAGSLSVDMIPKLWDLLLPGGVIVASVSDQYEGQDEANNARTARLTNAYQQFGGKLTPYDTNFHFTPSQLKQKLGGEAPEPLNTKVHMIEWVGKKPA